MAINFYDAICVRSGSPIGGDENPTTICISKVGSWNDTCYKHPLSWKKICEAKVPSIGFQHLRFPL
jgi:hypothetical protein